MPIEVMSPIFEEEGVSKKEAARLATLAGSTVGFLDNNKKNVGHFFTQLEEVLRSRYGVASVVRARKSNMSAPAPADVIERLRPCDAVVLAIGD